jgi:hypothetical protein
MDKILEAYDIIQFACYSSLFVAYGITLYKVYSGT